MSYCRWSSDNYRCDLYCYEDRSGFVTHVAASRVDGEVPPIVWDRGEPDFLASVRAQSEFLSRATRRAIGLPHGGATFIDADLLEFLKRLTSLRNLGYRVPPFVIEAVKEEIQEEMPSAPSAFIEELLKNGAP